MSAIRDIGGFSIVTFRFINRSELDSVTAIRMKNLVSFTETFSTPPGLWRQNESVEVSWPLAESAGNQILSALIQIVDTRRIRRWNQRIVLQQNRIGNSIITFKITDYQPLIGGKGLVLSSSDSQVRLIEPVDTYAWARGPPAGPFEF